MDKEALRAHLLKEVDIIVDSAPVTDWKKVNSLSIRIKAETEKGFHLHDHLPNGRKIVFGHDRAAGDGLMFSAGIRDFCLLFPNIKVNVKSNQGWIWENNPYLDRSINIGDPGVEFYKVGYPMGSVDHSSRHFSNMFLYDMIAMTDIHVDLPMSLGEFCAACSNGAVGDPPLGEPSKYKDIAKEPFIGLRQRFKKLGEKFLRQQGDLHLSEQERQKNMIFEKFGIERYWIVAPGGKRDCTSKIWDWRRFQQVIDHFKGKITFVSIGQSDLIVEPLKDVIDLVDKTTLRELVSLVYHSEGSVSGPSLLMHMAAAIPSKKGKSNPCVSILGGREPSSWTWYANHQVIHTNGIFSCCDNKGCWTARVHPLPQDPEHNKRLCKKPNECDGRKVQSCMDIITAEDVIRRIEMYYQGDLRSIPLVLSKPKKKKATKLKHGPEKTINILGNLTTAGGGEQSMLTIANELRKAGWKVTVYPFGSVHQNYKDVPDVAPVGFKQDNGASMASHMISGVPLLFYGNDSVNDFIRYGSEIVGKSSSLIVGINYMVGLFKDPTQTWVHDKLMAVIFQNDEKKQEWQKQVLGNPQTKLVTLFGAIDIDKMYEICPAEKKKDEPLVVLKHCVADYRKYVTKESIGKGDKIHVWQKHLDKELDTKFYKRLLDTFKNEVRFEFMQAHDELVKEFRGDKRMVFYAWDEIPVSKFLAGGHVYLYRTSNMWRDQYPRVVAEALAAGLPVLTEPRDGTKDRVQYGDTGFYCVDFDGFRYALALLKRKDNLRIKMSQTAKDWAKNNLHPRRWVEVIEEYGN